MPATYTYNDGIEDAKGAVVQAWDAGFDADAPEKQMKLMMDIVGRLDGLKRRERRKRTPKPVAAGAGLDKILDEDRIKGPAQF